MVAMCMEMDMIMGGMIAAMDMQLTRMVTHMIVSGMIAQNITARLKVGAPRKEEVRTLR
jgi:hypothetical protein